VKFVTRPENIELSIDDGGEQRENTFVGRIVSRVYLGEIAEYTIRVGDDVLLLARAHPSNSLAQGESVRVTLPSERTIAIFE
jgi:ABC-type Fe3+/spermidine/putrescine transport system ATPase subunit